MKSEGKLMGNVKYHKCCVLLSGGVGARMGQSIPKQYIEIHGKTIFEYTLHSILAWKDMDSLIVVADPTWHKQLERIIGLYISEELKFLGFSTPGKNRQESIINALEDINKYVAEDAIVMIHDAVRPLVSSGLISACDKALKSVDGVMPYLELKDTVYESVIHGNNRYISKNMDRDSLVAGQTPEFFKFHKYLKCCKDLTKKELDLIHGSTEPAVLGGMKMALVKGEEGNFKITTPNDLDMFTEIVEERKLYEGLKHGSGSVKKTILYCINTASLVSHEKDMVKKMQRSFDIFSENADGVFLLWTLDKNYEKKLEIAPPAIKKQVMKFIEKYRSLDFARFIEYEEADREVENMDAYYGDWNYFAWKFQQLGKPVMIQNIEV